MDVTVTSIVSARDFGVIFSGIVAGRQLRFRARSRELPDTPGAGELWQVEGVERSTEYGPQVDVRHARRVTNSGQLVQRFIANHVPGVGPERARRLWDAYGEDLGDVLADHGNLEALASTLAPGQPLLGSKLAAAVVAKWVATQFEAKLLAWLDDVGFTDMGLARRLYRLAGEEALLLLQANPYSLVPLVAWNKLDPLGQRLLARSGAVDPLRDRRRLVGAVDEAIKLMLASGSTAAAAAKLEVRVAHLIGTHDALGLAADAVVYARAAGAVAGSEDVVRAPGAAAMEVAVEGHLRRLQGSKSSRRNEWAEIVKGISTAAQEPSPEQREACLDLLDEPVGCLSGGAGVGKTFTCRLVCDAWEAAGGKLVLCALAGKAALRLSRSTGRLARTISRMLAELDEREQILMAIEDPSAGKGKKPTAEKLVNLAQLTPHTLVVVDEASMIDLPSMHAVLRRMPDGAHLLMVGDDAQLPPVGFGLVYHRLVDDAAITRRLTHVHRQAAQTGIPATAAAVRRQVLPRLPVYQGIADGVFHLPDGGDLPGMVELVASQLGILDRQALIVTATNEGDAGVGSLNERLQDGRFGITGEPPMRGQVGRFFAEGEPVIYGRNDYSAGLFNGMMGTVTKTFPEAVALEVAFDGERERKLLEGEQLIDLQLAYAVTCHKCQGSSAPRIIIPLFRSRVLEPSWLYTAITRAEHQVVLVGDLGVLEDALARPFAAASRHVGFQWSGGLQ